MSSVTVFFLVCLGLLAVTSWQSSALKAAVPTPAQQCKNAGFFASCVPNDMEELVVHRCANLACAEKVPFRKGIYLKRLIGPPANGTSCGISKICVNTRCKLVNKHDIPKYIGSDKERNCRESY